MHADDRAVATRGAPQGQQWRAWHLLALLPAIGMLGGLPFANRVRPFVLGVPFLVAWLAGWVLATSAIMGVIYLLDRKHGLTSDDIVVPDESRRDTEAAR